MFDFSKRSCYSYTSNQDFNDILKKVLKKLLSSLLVHETFKQI